MTLARSIVVAVAIAVASAPASASPPPSPAPLAIAVTTTRLANGLELIVHEDHRTPRIAVSLWYHVGSKDEPPGRNGFAHLFEHLMLEAGSRHVAPGGFFKTLEGAGATNIQCTTTADRTNYREVVPSASLEVALWLESDRMAFLLDRIDAKVLDAQRSIVTNERKLNYDDSPLRLVEQMIRAEVFPANHPNHHSPIGDPGDLARATLDDARAFFRAWYGPNDATLVLAGDIDMAHAKPLVEKWFGAIAAKPTPPRRRVDPVKLAGEVRLHVEAQLGEKYVLVSWPTASSYAEGDAELAVLQRVLSGGRLSRRMLRDDAVARQVSVTHNQLIFGQFGELFEITAIALDGRESTDVLAAIDDELVRVRAGEITDAEVASARAGAVAELVFSVEKLTDRAERINEYAQMVGDGGFFARDRQRLEKVTRDAVIEAARRWLPKDRRVVTLVASNAKMTQGVRLVRATRSVASP